MHSASSILLVDDDTDDRELFVMALEQVQPVAVLEQAADGYIAWDMLCDGDSTAPDYIFMDINMPRMTGFECLAKIKGRSELSASQVIIWTTSNSDAERSKARKLGAYAFFTKPYSYKKLVEGLKALLQPAVLIPGTHIDGHLEVFG